MAKPPLLPFTPERQQVEKAVTGLQAGWLTGTVGGGLSSCHLPDVCPLGASNAVYARRGKRKDSPHLVNSLCWIVVDRLSAFL